MMSDSRYCFMIFFFSFKKKSFLLNRRTTRIKRSVIRYFSRGIGYEHYVIDKMLKIPFVTALFFCIKISAKVFFCSSSEFLIIYQISPHIPWFEDLEFLLSNWKRHCLHLAAVMELVWTCLMRILNVMIVAQVISSQNP